MPRSFKIVHTCDICGVEIPGEPIGYDVYCTLSGLQGVSSFGVEEGQVIACSGEHALEAVKARLQLLELLRKEKIAAAKEQT